VAPAGSERLEFTVGAIEVLGGFQDMLPATSAVINSVERRRITVARLYEVANELERLYARAGYFLVRVSVPPQHLTDGSIVKVVVVDGVIEAVSLDNVPERIRPLIAARTGELIGRRHLRRAEVERCLLVASDIPGLRLRSAIARGQTPGGTILVIEGEHRSITGSINVDNRLPDSLGTLQWSGSVSVNNAFGRGEQIYGVVGSSLNFFHGSFPNGPLRVVGGGAVVPIGSDGWTINPEVINSVTRPLPSPGTPSIVGEYERWSLRTSYPVTRKQGEQLNLISALDIIDQRMMAPAFATSINHDSYRSVRIGLSWRYQLPWGAPFQGSGQLSQGLGGRNAADATSTGIPLTRLGTSPTFTKLNAEARWTQPLAGDLRLDVVGRSQFSFVQPMFQSEQFSLNGMESVSAFPNGTLNADAGATVRGELTYPLAIQAIGVPMQMTPYMFSSGGIGWLYQPTAVEQAKLQAGAIGIGSRALIQPRGGMQSANFAMELARQFSNVRGRPDAYRLNLVASAQF
jgi:hemolysin activation/secretion protein